MKKNKFNYKKLNSIKSELENVGLYVSIDEMDDIPYLVIKKSLKHKRNLIEISFDKKGKIDYLIIGKKATKAAWIKVN